MFEYRLRFDLAAVLHLADQATSASETAVPGDAAPPLAADNAVYLTPATATGPSPDQVFAYGPGPAITWLERITATGTQQPLRISQPLGQPTHRPLLDQLRMAAGHGHDTLTLILSCGNVHAATSRRRHRTPRPPAAA